MRRRARHKLIRLGRYIRLLVRHSVHRAHIVSFSTPDNTPNACATSRGPHQASDLTVPKPGFNPFGKSEKEELPKRDVGTHRPAGVHRSRWGRRAYPTPGSCVSSWRRHHERCSQGRSGAKDGSSWLSGVFGTGQWPVVLSALQYVGAPAHGRTRRISSIVCGMSTATRRSRVDGETPSYCRYYADELTLTRTIA